MKPLWAVAVALLLTGCAEEAPPAEEVREQFQRGLSGQGHIVPFDRPGDPATPSTSQFPDSH